MFSPFKQLLVILLIGLVAYFILSSIITLFIDVVFPDVPISDIKLFRLSHPILYMILTIIPLQVGFLFIPGYIYSKLAKTRNWPIAIKTGKIQRVFLGIMLFVTTFFLLPLLTSINKVPLDYFDWYNELFELQQKQIEMITQFVQQDKASFLVAIVLISLITGVAEEYFFRGFIFRQMIDNHVNLYISWCLSGLIFALLHFNYVQVLPLFFFGVVLAIIYTLIGKLWLSIVLHSVNNLVQLIWIKIDHAPKWTEEIDYIITIPSVILLTGLIIFTIRLIKTD
jgi:membrane protease YdiL (CAAX protease family)